MADVNANIGVNIDTSNALAQLKALQRQISQFHTSISKSSEAAALAQRDLQRNFINSVNSIGAFSAELRTVRSTAESFTDSLEKNKFGMREYFRYAGGATKTFGKLFKSEFDTVNKVAEENVKRLQTQYIKMGRDASGAMRAIAIMPNELDMSKMSTQLQISAQRQALFNQLVKQGSTNLLNFGKNTQWAGRQLMVGFTLPLASLGSVASKTFMDMESAALKFRKVYGDLFTPAAEREQALADITALGQSFTQYGIAVSQTVGLAAEAAAAGFQGLDLQRQVTEATRLQVLGQIEQQKALETTISLQNAFQLSSEDLADSINFLNAVENQTVVSLDDITTAIPKAAPVVKQLGGDVRDLTFFMAAMKEGGINASEGANALKSGLASLINPTDKAREMMKGFGIDIDAIVNKNAGNVKQTVIEFASALDNLSDLNRQRAIEQLFGKFQLARLSTLFENVTKTGNQASRVLDLATASTADLAAMAESELGMTAESSMNKFRKAVEDLKLALVPVGQTFLESVTPILEFVGNILDKFNNMSAGVKKAITIITVALGAIAPVALMTFGLISNFVANGIKGFMLLRNGYLRLTGQSKILGEQTQYLTVEQQNALAVAHSLDQSHARLIQTFTAESTAVQKLSQAYERAMNAGMRFAQTNPGMMQRPLPGFKSGILSVPGSGTEDKYPAMLAAGEAVIPAKQNKKYAPLIQGIIADNIPGFNNGTSAFEGAISSRFIPTRRGRSATAGERAQRNIPGGYQLGHFTEPIKMTGQQLLEIAKNESQTVKRAIEALINSVSGDLSRMFDVFTNEVVAQSKEFNQALGEVGSGKRAPVSMFVEEAVGRPGAYNAPLIAKMKEAGASTKEIDLAVTQLGQAYSEGIEGLGNVTTVTAEEVNMVTQEALNRVSAVNEKVMAAREMLRQPAALKEVIGVTPGRVPFSGAYNTKDVRRDINEVVQEQAPGVFPTQQAFNFLGPQARQVGIQNAEAIAQLFDQLSTEAKQRVIALLGDIDAMSQQVVIEARNAGIDIGEFAIRGITDGIDAASPSQAAKKQGQNVADGFEQGILEGMDDASLAGQKLGDAGIDGIGQGTGGGGGARNAGRLAAGGAGGEGGNGIGSGVGKTTANLAKFNNALMGVSFAMTGVSGIASAFGGRFQGLSEAVFKISGVMFGLMSVVQLLTQEMFASVIANRANRMAMLANTGATSFKGLFTGVTGFGSKLLVATKFLIRFIGPVGAVAAGLAITASLIKKGNAEREKERQRIEAFSDVLKTTTDQMSFLGEYFNFVPQKSPLELFDDLERVSTAIRNEREQLKADPRFREQFGTTIQQVSGMRPGQARTALQLKGIELISKGMSREAVQTLIDSIKEEAGKVTLKFNFKDIKFDTPNLEGFAMLAGQPLQKFEERFTSVFDRVNKVVRASAFAVTASEKDIKDSINKMVFDELGSKIKNASAGMASFVNSLSGLVRSGQIDTATFRQAYDAMFKSITTNIKDSGAQLVIFQGILQAVNPKLANAAKGIQDVNKYSAILSATAAGASKELIKYAIAVFTFNDALAALRKERLSQGLAADATADDAKKYADSLQEVARVEAQLKNASEKSIEIFKKLNKAINTGGGGVGDGKKSIFQQAIDQLKQQQRELVNTNKAYNKLKAAGVETGRAFEIASDPILAAALANTKVGTEKWKELIDLINTVNGKLAKGELKNFFELRNADVDFQRRFAQIIPTLQKMGLEAEDIRDIMSNPLLAEKFIADLEDGQLNSRKLKEYIEQIPELKRIDILLNVTTKTVEEQFKDMFDKAMEYWDIKSAMVQAEYKPLIINAQAEVDNAKNAIDEIMQQIDDLQSQIAAKQRAIELAFDRPISALQNEIANLQRQIEIQIDRPIEELNRQIEALQRQIELQFDRPIAALQAEANDLSNALTLLDRAAQAINDKYDAQEKALQQISEVNQELINQEKQRISIADALTKGDISAAAQMAQEARAQAAAAASQRAGGVLQAAREKEIAGLRSASGMTRAQIEERQFQISQQIFALEKQRDVIQAQILVKQDQIYAIEQQRLPIIQQIKDKEEQIRLLEQQREAALLAIRDLEDQIYQIQQGKLKEAEKELKTKEEALKKLEDELKKRQDGIDKEKEKWNLAELALQNAKIKAGEYNGVIEAGVGLVGDLKGGWDTVAAAAQAAAEAGLAAATQIAAAAQAAALAQAAAAAIPSFSYVPGSPVGGGPGGGGAQFQFKARGGMIKRKYFARGGQSIGSDTVPAMLTPGEFVVNKAATKEFSPLLSAINGSKYPSMLRNRISSPIQRPSMTPRFRSPSNGVVSKLPISEPRFSGPGGGKVFTQPISEPRFSMPNNGMVSTQPFNKPSSESNVDNSSMVYNYNVAITVGGNDTNPKNIAKAVMDEIRYVDQQRVRTQRVS